jgi:DNA-directed RNA polymerase subunit alpha
MLDTSKFKITVVKNTDTYGKFELSPLVGGFGHTVGEGLRRTLLVTIPGAAITRIQVDGANHMFTSLPGVKEDLVEICLNLKKIKFAYEGTAPVKLVLSKKGEGVVTAADIADSTSCKVANPECHIATLTDSKSKLHIELTVERGVGYTTAREQTTDVVGEIILDATFTPVFAHLRPLQAHGC